MNDAEPATGPGLILEYLTQEQVSAIRQRVEEAAESSSLMFFYYSASDALRLEDQPRTRVVFTGHLVQSVHDRENRAGKPFTVERGSGVVAAKTMPPNADGVVDILVPIYTLGLDDDDAGRAERNRILAHTATHEAVHATIHHLGTEPFDVYRREEFGHASMQFVAMASEQVEEHLAEYLSGKAAPRGETGSGTLKAAFEAWQETLHVKLPAVSQQDPEYFSKGMFITFEALHIVWKALAYLAAELRDGDAFSDVSGEIKALDAWQEFVEPWWDDYVVLLGEVPMSTSVDIPTTDVVVKQLGEHLQRWALEIGFDFHDTDQGGWFQISYPYSESWR